jgi:abortive infection protein
MYIKNGFSVKNKWFYCLPISLFILLNLNAFFSPPQDYSALVAHIGELPFFTFNLLVFLFLLGVLLLIVVAVHAQPIRALTTGRKKIDYKRIFFSFFLWGSIISLQTLVSYWLTPSDYLWNFDPVPFFLLVLIALLLIPFQASFEEYFFRGYFLQATALVCKYKWIPLVLSSVFFGLVHVANPEIAKLGYGFLFFYISLGLFLGIITLMDNGLELSMGFHIANNFFIAFLSSSSWSVFQTPSLLKEVSEPAITPSYILLFYLPLVVLLFIFAKKYQWSNWKEKLLGKIEEKDI